MIKTKQSWLRIALLNLLITAILGILLRYAFVSEVSWLQFRPAMHGHSHVGMLGWIFLALYTFLIHGFLSEEKQRSPLYKRLFWGLQFSVIGMMIAFPIQGYAAVSIAFSTLHVLLSYGFVIAFFRDLSESADRTDTGSGNRPVSISFVKAALFFSHPFHSGTLGDGTHSGFRPRQGNCLLYGSTMVSSFSVQWLVHFRNPCIICFVSLKRRASKWISN